MKKLLSALSLLACLPAPLLAEEHAMCLAEVSCRAASVEELDELRGGFLLHTGAGHLRVGIGITRAVAVNDQMVAVSRLVVPDLGRAMGGLGQGIAEHTTVLGNGLTIVTASGDLPPVLVQVGANNSSPLPGSFGPNALPIIVQNTLDNQKLQTATIVEATVNALSVMNALRLGEMLGRATAASGR